MGFNSGFKGLKDSVGYKKQQKDVMPIWYLYESPVIKYSQVII